MIKEIKQPSKFVVKRKLPGWDKGFALPPEEEFSSRDEAEAFEKFLDRNAYSEIKPSLGLDTVMCDYGPLHNMRIVFERNRRVQREGALSEIMYGDCK